MKYKKWSALLLVSMSATTAWALAACQPEQETRVEGPETGVYYFDTGMDEYTISLDNVDQFTLLMGGESKKGTYTLTDGALYLDFADEAETDVTATLADNVIALTYENASMRFYKKVNYTVSFDTQGHGSVDSVEVVNGKTVPAVAAPHAEGYTFVGWYTDTTYMTPFLFDAQPVTGGDITLYAYWLETSEGQTEYTVDFDLGYDGEEIAPVQTVEGCVIASDLATPVREGYTFLGWYVSAFDSADKLTYEYKAGMSLREDTTLYALWRSDDEQGLAAPKVSVTASGVQWEAVSGAKVYSVTITGPDSETQTFRDLQTTSQAYDFSELEEGEYVVTVSASATNSVASDPDAVNATRYYKNKALAAVSDFKVIEPSALIFEGVENAQRYFLTIECGNPAHNHEEVALGSSTNYNFSNCPMQEGGILFTVRAEADGYASSTSKTFVYNRLLGQVTGLTYDEATETVRWDAVADATGYVVSVNGTQTDIGGGTSYCLKGYNAGELTVAVYPRTAGYNSPSASEITVNKTTLAAPQDIYVDGTVLNWAAVSGATSYTVRINGTEYAADSNSFDLTDSAAAGEVIVEVRANGTNNSLFSDKQTIRNMAMYGAPAYAHNTLTWSPVMGALYYEVQVNDGEIVRYTDLSVTSASVVLTQRGENILRVRFGAENDFVSDWAQTQVYAYEIFLDANGGSEVENLYVAYGDSYELPVPESDAYDFIAWYNIPSGAEGNGALCSGGVFEGRSDLMLYACWNGKLFDVTYDAQGGTLTETATQIRYGSSFTLAVPEAGEELAGRIFIGWYTAENGEGTRLTDENGVGIQPWNVAQNVTIYSFWAEVLRYVETVGSNGEAAYAVQAGPDIGYVTSVTIPAEYNGKPVTDIFSGAFRGCETLEEVNLPNSLQTLGSVSTGESTGSFAGCSNLKEINVYTVEGSHEVRYFSVDGVLFENSPQTGNVSMAYFPTARTGDYVVPDGIDEIPAYSFTRASISSVTIPSDVLFVRQRAFYYCLNLTEVKFTTGGTQQLLIEPYAFQGSIALQNITLPARMAEVDSASEIFGGCNSLVNIFVEEGSSTISSVDGVLCDATGGTLLYFPSGRAGTYTIPVSITAIGNGAFKNHSGIEQVNIGAYVESIGEGAFSGAVVLSSVVFTGSAMPQEMTIGKEAFLNCKALQTVSFGENSCVVSIGDSAFSGCQRLEAFTFSETITSIGQSAFEGCTTLEEVYLSGASVTVGNYAFRNCTSLDKVGIGASVEEFDFIAVFDDCTAITTLEVDAGNPFFSTYDNVLYNKDQTTLIFCPRGSTQVTVADTTTLIGARAFEGCRVEEVTLPEGVTEIGASAFLTSELSEIYIPASVTKIGDSAFNACMSLVSVQFAPRTADQKLTLGTSLFSSCSALSEISLPEGLETLPNYTFMSCRGLTSLTLPSTLKTIGTAFNYCSGLVSIVIPEGVTSLPAGLFTSCTALSNVTLPSTLTEIGANIFSSCTSLTKITIPANVEKLTDAFKNCKSLAEIEVDAANTHFKSDDGILYNADQTELIYCPPAKTGELTIPDGVKEIGSYAFQNSVLTKIVLNDELETLGDYAFSSAKSITEMTLPDSVTSVGNNLFDSCSALTTVTLSANLTRISDKMFNWCSKLENLTIPENVTEIGSNAFYFCSALTELTIPESVTVIKDHAFASCSALTELEIPEGVTSVEGYLFQSCSQLVRVTLPSTVTSIGNMAFYMCRMLTSVTLPEELESIAANAFAYCSALTEIVIPDSVTSLGMSAFSGCSALESVNLPEGITSIQGSLFSGCSSLETIGIPESVTSIASSAFSGCSALTSVTLPSSIKTLSWSLFQNCTSLTEINIPEGVTSIDSSVFSGCTALKKVTLPDSLTSIGSSAFKGCTALAELRLPANVLSVAAGAFSGCTALSISVDDANTRLSVKDGILYADGTTALIFFGSATEVEIPAGVTTLADSLFANSKVTKVTLPSSITSLPNNLFDGCTALTEVVMQGQITSIGNYAFRNTPIASFTVANTVTSIGNYAFYGCANLSSLTFEEGGTSALAIGTNAFQNCTSLTSLTLPLRLRNNGSTAGLNASCFRGCTALESVSFGVMYGIGFDTKTSLSFGMNAFEGCSSLESILVPDYVISMASYAFQNCTSLTDITLSDPLYETNTYFNSGVFANCTSLESFDIPVNITGWSDGEMFSGCTSLKSVNAAKESRVFRTIDGNLYSADGTILYQYAIGKTETSFTVPDTVTQIYGGAFSGSKLSNVYIPESVLTISWRSFTGWTADQTITVAIKEADKPSGWGLNWSAKATVIYAGDSNA